MTVRLAVAGLGTIAHTHAANAQALGATVAVGLDPDTDARRRFTEAFDAPTVSAMPDLLAHDPDAVIVTTPNCFHEEYAVAALEAGIGVLCEKPLAHTVDSAERIVAAAREADAPLMVGFNHRYSGVAEAAAEAIADGRLGDLTHIEATFIRQRGIPGRGSWFTREDRAGGGALVDIGVHALDLALSLASFPAVESVTGQTQRQWCEPCDVEDRALGLLRCAGGQTIACDVAWAANRSPAERMAIEGSDGGAQFHLSGNAVTFYEGVEGGGSAAISTVTTSVDSASSHRRELAAFLECVRTGSDPDRNTPEEALAVQRVIDALYESARSGGAQAPRVESTGGESV